MDFSKTERNNLFKDFKKNRIQSISLITNKHKRIFDNFYSKISKLEAIKPADPLINRKNIKFNPIKFPSNIPTLKLPIFNYNSNKEIESFKLSSENINNINIINNINKEIQINNYINNSKMLQRLIYSKKPPDKDDYVTIDNIINLNEIDNIKNQKMKKKISQDLFET